MENSATQEYFAVLEQQVGRTAIEEIASEGLTERGLLGTVVVSAVGLFLLQAYCKGFLKGLGLDEMSEAHGRRAQALIRSVRAGVAQKVEALLAEAQASIDELARPATDSTKIRALVEGKSSVREFLESEGMNSEEAERIAQIVSASAHKAAERSPDDL